MAEAPLPGGRRVLVVDGANVVGARADGWWRDRAGAAERLLAGLARLADDGVLAREWPVAASDPAARERGRPEVVVVLEGRANAAEGDPAGLTVVRAGGEGDDAVVTVAADLRAGGDADVVVVTSDRELRHRVEAAGARVRGAGWLRGLLDTGPPRS